MDATKPIRLSHYAREQLTFRGATEAEVMEAIRTAPWGPAELNRVECRYETPYNRMWHNRFYATKQVRPIFVEERRELVVITVYTYYG